MLRKTQLRAHISSQSGIALPIALILLLVSTLIGVTALRTSALSEKMTRNTIQREVAFSKAETALLEAETLVRLNATAIKNVIENAALSNTCEATFEIGGQDQKGFCSPANHPQAGAAVSSTERWRIADLFTDETAKRYVEIDDGSRYIVEFLGHIFSANNNSQCPTRVTTWPYCDQDPLQFRITAFAEGDIEGETSVVLQSTYVASP